MSPWVFQLIRWFQNRVPRPRSRDEYLAYLVERRARLVDLIRALQDFEYAGEAAEAKCRLRDLSRRIRSIPLSPGQSRA